MGPLHFSLISSIRFVYRIPPVLGKVPSGFSGLSLIVGQDVGLVSRAIQPGSGPRVPTSLSRHFLPDPSPETPYRIIPSGLLRVHSPPRRFPPGPRPVEVHTSPVARI